MATALYTSVTLRNILHESFREDWPVLKMPSQELLDSVNDLGARTLRCLGRLARIIATHAYSKRLRKIQSWIIQHAVFRFVRNGTAVSDFARHAIAEGAQMAGKFAGGQPTNLHVDVGVLTRIVNLELASVGMTVTDSSAAYLAGVIEYIVVKVFDTGFSKFKSEWPPTSATFVTRVVLQDPELWTVFFTQWEIFRGQGTGGSSSAAQPPRPPPTPAKKKPAAIAPPASTPTVPKPKTPAKKKTTPAGPKPKTPAKKTTTPVPKPKTPPKKKTAAGPKTKTPAKKKTVAAPKTRTKTPTKKKTAAGPKTRTKTPTKKKAAAKTKTKTPTKKKAAAGPKTRTKTPRKKAATTSARKKSATKTKTSRTSSKRKR